MFFDMLRLFLSIEIMNSYPFTYKEQHDAEALVVMCIDFRFREVALDFIQKEENVQSFDVVEIGGAGKSLCLPKDSEDFHFAIGQIDISHRLHHIKTIYLMHHADCGAYGGRRAFDSLQEERVYHLAELKKAKKVLLKKYPDVEVKKVLLNLNEDQSEVVPEIIANS